jgi:hypothetical protein
MKAGAPKEEQLMAKAMSRKHGAHKKARAHHHAAKTHNHRPQASRASTPRAAEPAESKAKGEPEPEIIDEEFSIRAESRTFDEDPDEEVGIYGPNRGETAG